MPTLDFKGKPFVYSHHLSVPFRELKIDAGKSLPGDTGPSLDDNLIIHGDNLHALKALLPKYAGKVDVIYIDPPYNTGNEGWAYNDNVNSPLMKEWLGKVVDGEDLERHDKWLCMMWPRLVLLRELLSETGVIYMTIDDNEMAVLAQICDEIFGKENFLTSITWQKKYSPQNDAKYYSSSHDHIFAYCKQKEKFKIGLLPRTEAANARYKNPDNDPRGPWKVSDLTRAEYRERDDYVIISPTTGKQFSPPKGNSWGRPQKTVEEMITDNRIWFGPDGNSVPQIKRFLTDVKQGITPQTLWFREDVGDNQEAKKEIKSIFNDVSAFETPKPVRLIERMIRLSSRDSKNSLVLDSFAGSGTTAHAVQALNVEDGGNRKFILIETEDYADTITAERVRRAIKGVPNAKREDLRKGLGGSFTYCDLGDPIDMESFFGESDFMPAYDQLASYIAYTATGEALGKAPKKPAKDWYIGEAGGVRLHLIYKPDSAFMKSHDAALDMDTVKTIAASNKMGKPSYVFAAAKYMGQSELTRDYDMTFCQLPYAIHRIMGDGVDG